MQSSSMQDLNEKPRDEYTADYRVTNPVSTYAYTQPPNVYQGAQIASNPSYRAW